MEEEDLPLDNELTTAPINLPETTSGDLSGAIDAATIGQFNRQSDLDFINQQFDPLVGQRAAVASANDSLFRGGASPNAVTVGVTGGSIVGSSPIIVEGGGGIPLALLERQRAAQQQLDFQRAKDLRLAGANPTPKLKQLSDARLNRGLVDTFNKTLSTFQQEALVAAQGDRAKANAILTDPRTDLGRRFLTQTSNINQLSGEVEEIITDVAAIKKATQEGGQFVSKEQLELVEDLDNLTGSFESLDPQKIVDLNRSRSRASSASTLDALLKSNNTLPGLKANIQERERILSDDGEKLVTQTQRTEIFENAARAAARTLKQDASQINGPLSEDDIFQNILSRLGSTTETTLDVRASPGAGAGKEKQADVNARATKINTIFNGFNTPDGNPSIEARNAVGSLVGADSKGNGKVTEASFGRNENGDPVINLTGTSLTGGVKFDNDFSLNLTKREDIERLNALLNESPSES